MKPLRIFHHKVCEPPAYLCTYLEQCGLDFEVICIHENQKVPNSLTDISGLIFMGGQGSVNDNKVWIKQELEIIKQADLKNIPMLGVCFGAQLISKALGGVVYTGEEMEIGWHHIKIVSVDETEQTSETLNNIETKQRWLENLPRDFEVFQWHAHTFSVPPGATALWTSQCFQQQGYVKGRVLGMQFHLEATTDSILELSQHYADDLSRPSKCVQSAVQITDKLVARTEQLHQIADQVYGRWLRLTGLL